MFSKLINRTVITSINCYISNLYNNFQTILFCQVYDVKNYTILCINYYIETVFLSTNKTFNKDNQYY